MTLCQKVLKQECTARRIESMQQSSATPRCREGVAEDCCMLSILPAVPSCFNTFWHYILLHFNDFYTCFTHFFNLLFKITSGEESIGCRVFSSIAACDPQSLRIIQECQSLEDKLDCCGATDVVLHSKVRAKEEHPKG